MNILETQLPSMYSQHLHDNMYNMAPQYIDKVADILFSGSASLLSDIKSPERPAALVFYNINKTFVAAGIVEYFENTDESNPGNWSLSWTFNESDLPENVFTVQLSDSKVQPHFTSLAMSKFGMQFINTAAMENLLTDFLIYLKKWLDENAKEGEEVTIEQDGVFVATVAVENGEKVFALSVEGEIKQYIKNDAGIEK